MSRYQFETDLRHLEQIIPLLVRGNSLALSYWRRRISSLLSQQGLLPDGNRRITRLLNVFDEVERALISGKPPPDVHRDEPRRVYIPVTAPSNSVTGARIPA
jgi:hypothetical protein